MEKLVGEKWPFIHDLWFVGLFVIFRSIFKDEIFKNFKKFLLLFLLREIPFPSWFQGLFFAGSIFSSNYVLWAKNKENLFEISNH